MRLGLAPFPATRFGTAPNDRDRVKRGLASADDTPLFSDSPVWEGGESNEANPRLRQGLED